MSDLTEEQKKRIEENRLKALQKRAAASEAARNSTKTTAAVAGNCNIYNKSASQPNSASNAHYAAPLTNSGNWNNVKKPTLPLSPQPTESFCASKSENNSGKFVCDRSYVYALFS